MSEQEKWAAVMEALDKAVAALQGWPGRRKMPARAPHLVGYSRERGRRSLAAP